MNVLVHDGPSLSEKILLHCDAALLGLDFVTELAVDHQVKDPVPVILDLDLHEQLSRAFSFSWSVGWRF
jgi:hypothetical protein